MNALLENEVENRRGERLSRLDIMFAPMGYVDGANLYEFVTDNPLTFTDPSGLREMTAEERNVVTQLGDLANKAKDDDPEFSKAVSVVSNDYQQLIANIKKDENDPLRLKILNIAFNIWSDSKQASTYTDAAGEGNWKGKNKCNKYVGDVITKGGVDIQIDPGRFRNKRLPTANEWADPKNVGSFKIVWEIKPVKQGEGKDAKVVLDLPLQGQAGARAPQLGDIIVYPHEGGGSGHVGIYLGGDLYISATSFTNHGQNGIVIKGRANDKRQIYRSPD